MAINPKIKQKAEDIRKKIFGAEVRESLASGLEGMSEDVESIKGRQGNVENQFQDVLDETTGKDVINGPEVIAARNGEANLKTRLDKEKQEVTAQLQQTKTNFETEMAYNLLNDEQLRAYVDLLQQQVTSMGDISPKPFETFANLVSADPPKTGIYVVTADGNWYYWNSISSEWTVGGKYQSSGIADDTISAKKLEKKMTKVSSINLLDPSEYVEDGYYNTLGVWVDNLFYRSSGLIPVKPTEVLSRTLSPRVGNQVSYWDKEGNYVNGTDIGPTNKSFTVPNIGRIAYMRISMLEDVTQGMVVRGTNVPTSFVDGSSRIISIKNENLDDGSVSTSKLLVELKHKTKRNLFDFTNLEDDGYYSLQGVWTENPFYASSHLIPAFSKQTFTRSYISGFANIITFWGSNNEFISSMELGASILTFVVPNNPDIVGFKFSLLENISTGMISEGLSVPSTFVSFNEEALRIDEQNLINYSVSKNKLSKEVYDKIYNTDNVYIRPFTKVDNPVLTKNDVTDRTGVVGVADPFIVNDKGRYHMFFEVLYTEANKEEIGHAYSDDLLNWTYTQIVLPLSVGHRSAYPNVFKVDGIWYMLPDTTGNIELYRSTNFPYTWEKVNTLISGVFYDTNIFRIGDIHYLTTGNEMKLYYNDSGDWKNNQWIAHPVGTLIPLDSESRAYRGGGTIIHKDDHVYLPIQVTPVNGVYGEYTYLYKFGNFSKTTASATNMGKFIGARKTYDWNHLSMHHASGVDYIQGKKVYAVDGQSRIGEYSIGIYIDN